MEQLLLKTSSQICPPFLRSAFLQQRSYWAQKPLGSQRARNRGGVL
jgi:hypothetical protein